MFEDSLVESSGRLAHRNPWSAAISFAGQILVGGILILLSLIYTEALPTRKLITDELPPPPLAAAPETHVLAQTARQPSEFKDGVLVPPREIPRHISEVHDESLSANAAPGFAIPGAIPGAPPSPQLNEALRNTTTRMPTVAVPKIRLSSGVTEGMLLRQIKPQYPPLARQARIQGTVVLQALIGKDGTIENPRVASGHPMLTQAAIEAVKQWLYQPYYLNNQPVEVDTEIRVNFTLANE